MQAASPHLPAASAAIRDHSRTFRDFTFVYPVISRRSRGLSIGINLNPDKICNFDCIYCQVDRRTPGKADAVALEQVREELLAIVHQAKSGGLAKEPRFSEVADRTRVIRDFAFSGDGEPTMVRNFYDCVRTVAEVKQETGLSETKIVLITDGAGLDKSDVKRGLEFMDAHQGEIWGKLDAGTPAYFHKINRTSVRFDRILRNLRETAQRRPIIIQTLFLKIRGQAMSQAELEAYVERLFEILEAGGRIRHVQAYTIARPTPVSYVSKLDREDLEAVAQQIRKRTGLQVETYE